MRKVGLAIIGGGPAGLAAAVAAYEAGCRDLLILEREDSLGGILKQCIHNGFGLHTFKEELTGPEYAQRYIEKIIEYGIPCRCGTMVIDITRDRKITCVSKTAGLEEIEAGAVILAMGCRERPRGSLGIPGQRCSGIYTAGTAQRFVNMEGVMPGKKVMILGSGDIGLIMARRMTFMGAEVKGCVELMPFSAGLKRNIVQCLDDYGIPLLLSHTVVDIAGRERLEGVTVAAVDERLRPIPGTEKYYECDTLLLSVGLIPENELSAMAGVEISTRQTARSSTSRCTPRWRGYSPAEMSFMYTIWLISSPRRRRRPERTPGVISKGNGRAAAVRLQSPPVRARRASCPSIYRAAHRARSR